MAFALLGDGDRAAELFSLLNPVNHGRTGADVARYRAEPYVVAADVYSVPPHTGRGGWTWYTGIGGLDVSRRDRERSWASRCGAARCTSTRAFRAPGPATKSRSSLARHTVPHRRRESRRREPGVKRLEVDGVDRTGHDIPILDDGAEHPVRVVLG